MAEIIKAIRYVSDYRFLYSVDEIKSYTDRNFEVKDASMEEMMTELLKGTGLTYELEQNVIMIKPASNAALPQEKTVIQGVVKEKNGGGAIPGVTVIIKGTVIGTVTDAKGNFRMQVPPTDSIRLIFSFIGMKSLEVAYTGQETLNIEMEEDAEKLQEVVVTGIFERPSEGFTGDVTRISGDEIAKLTAGNPLRALAFLDPNFRIVESNYAGSNPNSLPEFQIRGTSSLGDYTADDVVMLRGDYESRPNQPLFVLDGVIGVSITKIIDLDPEYIESMTLLKDATAAAMYGSNSANGVVVVVTKPPLPGKLRVSYSGNYGLEYPDLTGYNLTNAAEKLQVELEAGHFNGNDLETKNRYAHLQEEVLRGVDTYWLSKPLRTTFAHRHSVVLEGGDHALRYSLRLALQESPGIMKGTSLSNQEGGIKLMYRFNKFQIDNNLSFTKSGGDRVSPYGSFTEYTLVNPYYRAYDEEGNIIKYLDGQSTHLLNPIYNTIFSSKNTNKSFNIMEALSIKYEPMKNLRFQLDLTLNRTDGVVDVFTPSQHTNYESEWYLQNPEYKGDYKQSKSESLSWELRGNAAYNISIHNKHIISLYLSGKLKESTSNSSSIHTSGFPNDKLNEVYMGTRIIGVGGSESVARSFSTSLTANYGYLARYYVDFNLSVSGSSEFGRDNRFAPFWSAGIRWNAHREKFIESSSVFSNLVFRASYGISGSEGFTPYQTKQMYTYAGSLMTFYRASDVSGAAIRSVGNPDLKWQQTRDFSTALEFGLFRDVISGRFGYYYKQTDNMLMDKSLAPSVGFRSRRDNMGSTVNEGYDVSLRIYPYRNMAKGISWYIVLNGARNTNKIKKISNALKIQNEQQIENTTTRPLPRYEEGYSQSIIWAVKSLGVDPVSGREVYVKRDGSLTNIYSAVDQIPAGDKAPKLSGNLATSLNYKGVELTVNASYKFGGKMYNTTLVDKVENADLYANVDRRVFTERWTTPGELSQYVSRLYDPNRGPTRASTRFIMDDKEFYLNNISLRYRFDSQKHLFLKRIHMSSLSIAGNVSDVFRISSIKMERGIDYPFSRKISFTVSASF